MQLGSGNKTRTFCFQSNAHLHNRGLGFQWWMSDSFIVGVVYSNMYLCVVVSACITGMQFFFWGVHSCVVGREKITNEGNKCTCMWTCPSLYCSSGVQGKVHSAVIVFVFWGFICFVLVQIIDKRLPWLLTWCLQYIPYTNDYLV